MWDTCSKYLKWKIEMEMQSSESSHTPWGVPGGQGGSKHHCWGDCSRISWTVCDNGWDPTGISYSTFSKGMEKEKCPWGATAQQTLLQSWDKAGRAERSCWRETQLLRGAIWRECEFPTKIHQILNSPFLFFPPHNIFKACRGWGSRGAPCLWNAVCCRQCRESQLLTASHKTVIFGVASEEATSWNRAHLFCVSLSCHFLQREGKSETTCLEERA